MVADLSALIDIDDETFAKEVEPDLVELEDIRILKIAAYEGRQKLGSLIALVGTPITGFIDYMMLFGGWLSSSSDDSGAGLTIAFLGALWWWVSEPKRQYTRSYKEKILPKIAKTLGNLTYCAKGRVIVDGLKGTKIVPKYNKKRCEDYFEGEYKGTQIKLSEMKLQYESGSGKNKSTKTVFEGIAFLIDVPKKIFGHTILKPNQHGFFEWINEKNLDLDRANLVSPEFEDIYDVYTNDQVEARYLVHPVMIEKFTALSKEYEGGKLSAAYYQGKLLLLLPSKKDHFEPADIKVEATNIATLLDMKHELTTVLSIVDQLELIDIKRDVPPLEVKNSDAAA